MCVCVCVCVIALGFPVCTVGICVKCMGIVGWVKITSGLDMTVILSHTAVLLDCMAYFTGIAMCVGGGGGNRGAYPTLSKLRTHDQSIYLARCDLCLDVGVITTASLACAAVCLCACV